MQVETTENAMKKKKANKCISQSRQKWCMRHKFVHATLKGNGRQERCKKKKKNIHFHHPPGRGAGHHMGPPFEGPPSSCTAAERGCPCGLHPRHPEQQPPPTPTETLITTQPLTSLCTIWLGLVWRMKGGSTALAVQLPLSSD